VTTVPSQTSRPGSDQAARDALLAQAVRVHADAIFCQDLDGVVTTWNDAAERIYGYAAADMVGHHANELLPEGTHEDLLVSFRQARTGTRVERFDTMHRRSDGTLVAVDVSATPLHDEHGQVVAVATTVADVSQRVSLARDLDRVRLAQARQNAVLTRSNRDLEQFAYVASHDLSEPLRVMTGYVGQLEHRYADVLDERGLRYMRHISEASVRMRALVDDLLEYSRFLHAPRALVQVDTRAVLERVLRLLGRPLAEADVAVTVGELPSVCSDAAQLESLLSNLISNAVKFTSPDRPPAVAVHGSLADGWVTLVVDDSGIGVPEEYRARVFRMFQRLHVREAYPGTGIGLAIVQQIVEQHDGRIWIEDSPLGGARFCCTLPAGPEDGDPDA
jgi:PAS domain S-box-containing protein